MTRIQKQLLRYIADQKAAFLRLSRKAHRKPSETTLHHLRITTRRIRTALWLLEHSSAHLSFDKIQKHLCKLNVPLGKHRELDVAIKDAAGFRIDPSPLVRKRRNVRKAIHRKLRSPRRRRIATELQRMERTLRLQKRFSISPALETMREELRPWINRSTPATGKIHQLRVAVKKTRYTLEATGKPLAGLNSLQDLLGRAHDLAVLQSYIGTRSSVKRSQRVARLKALRLTPPTLRAALQRLNG